MPIELVDREIALILDSNPATGAINRSEDGSSFEIQFEEPLLIPPNAINPTLDVEESAIWYSTPNIISTGVEQNNAFDITELTGPAIYNFFLPQGLYSIISIQDTMNALVKPTTGGDIFQITLNDATGKVEIFITNSNFSLTFPPVFSIGPILGFLPNTTLQPLVINVGPTIPAINAVNFYLVQCNLVQDGIRFNNKYNGIIETVLIDVAPRELIINRPFNPPTIPIDELCGNPRSKIRVQLLTDKLVPAETDGEFFYVRLSLRWREPIMI